MATLFREAPLGQTIRLLTGSRVFSYPEEQNGFVLPDNLNSSSSDEKSEQKDGIVDWYSPTDPDNPRNWSTGKKCVVFAQICLYTFSALCGSSITAPAEELYAERYGLSSQVSGLVLSMYVLGCVRGFSSPVYHHGFN